jgi:hypothetical protein
MPIQQVLNDKVVTLNTLVNDNTLPSQQLGRELFNFYVNGWGDEPRYIKPILPGDFLRNKNGIFGQEQNRYEMFAQYVLDLLRTRNLGIFLNAFLTNITDPHNNIAPNNIKIARYANGWYIGTFFLTIKYPSEYLWIFKYKNNKNALINLNLANSNQVNFFKATPFNTQPYFDLMNQLQEHGNYNGNFSNLLNYIESNYIE